MTPEIKQRIEQIRRGDILEGYKKTKAGILPGDWDVYMLGDCLSRVERPVEVKPNELYTQIGIRSHGKGLFYKEPVAGAALGNKAVFWIEPDCFIVNIVFAWEQAIGKTTQSEVGMIGSHRFPMYRPVNDRVDIDYLISYFLTKRGTDILEAASPGGAGRNKTLGQDRFLKSKIVLPPIEEQQKIAASENYLDFNRDMFDTAFSFLDEYRLQGYKILIHCNQGESRAPTIGLLYIARLGAFKYADFDTSVQKLKEIYPAYMPKRNIFLTVKSLWRDFVQNPVEEVNT